MTVLFATYPAGYLLKGVSFLQVLEYPKTVKEFRELFQTEEACASFVAAVRWPNGPVCPRCGFERFWSADSGKILQCAACRHKIRIQAGTIFQDTHLSLKDWLSLL
jgi:hypothetical protein